MPKNVKVHAKKAENEEPLKNQEKQHGRPKTQMQKNTKPRKNLEKSKSTNSKSNHQRSKGSSSGARSSGRLSKTGAKQKKGKNKGASTNGYNLVEPGPENRTSRILSSREIPSNAPSQNVPPDEEKQGAVLNEARGKNLPQSPTTAKVANLGREMKFRERASDGSSYESVPETAPGLEVLGQTSTLYVVQRSDPLDFFSKVSKDMLLSSYNVLNDKGQTIFYISETQRKCFLCARWSHSLGIYSVPGKKVMSVLKRNPCCCNRSSGPEVDKFIHADATLYAEETFTSKPPAAYHAHLPSGEFLGHLKVIESDFDDQGQAFKYIVVDAKYQELYRVQHVKPTDEFEQRTDPFFSDSVDSFFEIYCERRRLGRVHSEADARRFGVETDCSQATFPADLTDAEKGLILGLVAVVKCQTISADEHMCETCCVFASRTKCIIV